MELVRYIFQQQTRARPPPKPVFPLRQFIEVMLDVLNDGTRVKLQEQIMILRDLACVNKLAKSLVQQQRVWERILHTQMFSALDPASLSMPSHEQIMMARENALCRNIVAKVLKSTRTYTLVPASFYQVCWQLCDIQNTLLIYPATIQNSVLGIAHTPAAAATELLMNMAPTINRIKLWDRTAVRYCLDNIYPHMTGVYKQSPILQVRDMGYGKVLIQLATQLTIEKLNDNNRQGHVNMSWGIAKQGKQGQALHRQFWLWEQNWSTDNLISSALPSPDYLPAPPDSGTFECVDVLCEQGDELHVYFHGLAHPLSMAMIVSLTHVSHTLCTAEDLPRDLQSITDWQRSINTGNGLWSCGRVCNGAAHQ